MIKYIFIQKFKHKEVHKKAINHPSLKRERETEIISLLAFNELKEINIPGNI